MFKIKTEGDQRFMDAAVTVRNKFKRGKVKEREFDMSTYGSKHCSVTTGKCGTVHCIGGWINLELGGDGQSNPVYDVGLDLSLGIEEAANKLFQPRKENAYISKRSSAIEALDNFIAGRKDPWRSVKVETKKGF